MPITFTKQPNGNIVLNKDGETYNIGKDFQLKTDAYYPDHIYILSKLLGTFPVNWNDVTNPVSVSRDDLLEKLNNLTEIPAYDTGLDTLKVIAQNPVWNRRTDAEPLVTAQALTATPDNLGAVIDMRGYTHLGIFVFQDANDSENVDLTIKCAYEPADESVRIPRDWMKSTGEYKFKELTADDPVLTDLKKGTKVLECVTAGTVAFQSSQAYGTWEFEAKGIYPNHWIMSFISDNKDMSAFTGYAFVRLDTDLPDNNKFYIRKYISGSIVDDIFIAVAPYNFLGIKITRSLSGEFLFYAKGDSYGKTYQLLGSYNDNTITNSKFSIFYASGSLIQLANIKYRKGIN